MAWLKGGVRLADVRKRNIIAFSALVLGASVQFVIVLATIFSFIPIHLNDFVKTLLPLYWDQVRPHRQLQFYSAFILFGISAQAAGMVFLKKYLQELGFYKKILPLVMVQWAWVMIEATAAFKIFAFGNPAWARWFLYLSLLLWAANLIFWPEAKNLFGRINRLVLVPKKVDVAKKCFDVALPLLVVILLWPANFEKLLAHIYTWDNFFHLDFFVMSPGWAYLHGLSINMDVNSNYNVILPAFLSNLAHMFGGFNYENVLRWIVILTLGYYVAVWGLLREWLSSSLLAAFGFLLFVKLNMFHWGILPVLWRYPSATPVRYLFDLVPIFFIFKHSSTGKEKYLWLASLTSGLMLAFMTEVGLYLTVAFYAYGFMLMTIPDSRRVFLKTMDLRRIAGLVLLPAVSGFLLLAMVQGSSVVSSSFWANTTEYARLFLNGFGSLPYSDGLHDKQFFAFCMGFVVPAVYVLTMMMIGALLYLGEMEIDKSFVIYLCVYGLGMYHYFVYRSAVTSYYVVCLPFVLVLCFWVQQFIKLVSAKWQRIFLSVLVTITFGCLVTGYLFTVYPNILNMAGLDFTQEINFYHHEFNFDRDAALIDQFTSPDQKVALVSSYETGILMQANRKPFFYFFPMVYSEPFENLDFKGTELLTYDRVKRILAQLDEDKPSYVFVEKKLISGQLPAALYQQYQSLTVLLEYIVKNYQPVAQGQWLVALKRK